jgi:probable rRNA maturation factor
MLSVHFVTDDASTWPDLDALQPLIEQAASMATQSAAAQTGQDGPFEATINLSNDAEVQELNKRYRDKDKPTNVLSFPFENDFPDLFPGPQHLGDLILARETVEREARDQNIPFNHHVAHLAVHGILHLFGFDHIDPVEADEMELLEKNILETIGIPSPYAEPLLNDRL